MKTLKSELLAKLSSTDATDDAPCVKCLFFKSCPIKGNINQNKGCDLWSLNLEVDTQQGVAL